MKVKVRQVGNSLTVTIPKEIVVELGIGPDVVMDVSVDEERVVMRPVQSRWERLLTELRGEAQARGLTERDIDQALADIRGERRS